MRFYEFGEETKPVIMLLPGTCCYWRSNFADVIEPLQRFFRVVCVSYDGFDETEKTEFPTMLEETEKIERYINEKHGGHICAAYGCSLGGSFVGLLAARGKIRMDYGILGSTDLDQAGALKTKLLCMAAIPLIYPFIRDGEYKGIMKRISDKKMQENREYREKFMAAMKGPEGKGLPFATRRSVENQFASDMITPLPDKIALKDGEIHILYALKMGEKYRERYLQHFAAPVLHEFDLQHEELLVCYPGKWVKTIEAICKTETSAEG